MPLSKRRKKKGKVVKNNPDRRAQRLEEADIRAGVSLQDLINVVAYQEYVKDGTIIADDAKIDIPVELPITVEDEDEDGNKRRVGTATTIPGTDGVSINITDPDFEPVFHGDTPNFSIDKVEDQG